MIEPLSRAAEVIEHVLSRHGEHGTYLDAARALDAAGLIASPAHDAAVAARALREAAESMWRHKDPGHWNLRGEVDPDLAASPDVWIEWRADRIERAEQTDPTRGEASG